MQGTSRAWTEVAHALAPGNASIGKQVLTAVERPDDYVDKHARTLADRGVKRPIARLPLIALLDALDAARLVALVDWKEATEDAVASIRGLKKKLSWTWMKRFDEDDLDDLPMDRLLKAIAAEASSRGLALVNLDTSSDQYAIAVVDRARTARIVHAMKRVGHPAQIIAAKPLPPPKPAVTRGGYGTPMTKWPAVAKDAFGSSRFFFQRERHRSLWTRYFQTAFRVMEGTAWNFSMKAELHAFETAAQCTRNYVAFVEQLQRDGWLQFTEVEANKELRAHEAARKNKRR